MPAISRRKALAFGAAAAVPHYAIASPMTLAETPVEVRPEIPGAAAQAEWETMYNHLESEFQALYTWRVPVWTTAGQIARYMMPRRYYYFITPNMYNQGLRQDQAIVDRTATLAGEVCAAGLMAGLTDPDRPWLELGPAIPNFQLDKAAKNWYADLTERYNYILVHSNFYEAQAQHYEDLVFFGTAVAIDYEDAENIINVFTPCFGEYLLGVNFENNAMVMDREFRQTVRQMVDMFGLENCPPDVQQLWKQKGGALEYENVIGHCIEPNFAVSEEAGGPSVGVVPGGFPWREVYWVRGKKNYKPLLVNGFHDQPFGASYWNRQGNEAYGRGVGENMLGDTIQLQLETRQKAESIEKVNRPPMGADVSLQNLPTSTNPAKITYMNTRDGGEKKFFPLFQVKPDIPALTADIREIQERIRTTAYNDIFRMMEDLRDKTKGQVTATEIDALKEERLMRLGPVIGRAYTTLRGRVKRHMGIMARRGLIPAKPPSLRGVPTRIDFVSILTAAQKATRTAAIARTAQFAGSLSGAWPETKFVVDAEQSVRDFADGVGAPANTIRTQREVKAMIALEKKNQQIAQLTAQTLPGAQAAKALSETKLAPGTALSALAQPPGQ